MAGNADQSGEIEPIANPFAPPIASLWAQAAHDLRQPVQAALLLTSTLDDLSEGAELGRAAGHIRSALRSLSEMLEVLTLLARIEAGLQAVPLRAFCIGDDLGPAAQELAEIAASRGALLRVGDLSASVRSHPKLLVVLVRSLILNALKHGNRGEIEVGCRHTSSDHLRLEVRFSGALLDMESNKPAFVQLSAQGGPSADELGLGFPLLKHLCRQLGHGLQHTTLDAGQQVLALTLPLPTAPDKSPIMSR